MAKYIWYKGKVVDIIDETHNIKRFFIEIPELENYTFHPGQFAMLDLPINSKITNRSYSIASPPNSGNVVELIIVLNEAGLGTHYLFDQINIGSDITISSPLGKFVLEENINRDICFICTGVGVAPFRSMYRYIYSNNIPHQHLYMIFGTRRLSDLCYAKELQEADAKHNSFHYIPTLSRESSAAWTGRKGYVHDAYKELFSDKRPAYFYICGWKAMIFEARDNLLAMGYDKAHIKYELYD
ncbi:MAG: FAD-binding oxidoreductase [Chitinophagales bacterium]|nr:FAD-binding oxidoreductase [Chitinophagales bacterium]